MSLDEDAYQWRVSAKRRVKLGVERTVAVGE